AEPPTQAIGPRAPCLQDIAALRSEWLRAPAAIRKATHWARQALQPPVRSPPYSAPACAAPRVSLCRKSARSLRPRHRQAVIRGPPSTRRQVALAARAARRRRANQHVASSPAPAWQYFG